jgi:CheY-like chemotaxis protein
VRIPRRADESGDRVGNLTRALRDKEELLVRERRARAELERASRLKDHFIAVLSHELRAPLNAVLGWTQLLHRDAIGEEGRARALATIERNARAQAHLIDELLDITRMAEARIQLELTAVDVGILAQRIAEGLMPRAQEGGLTLTFFAEPGLVVLGDRCRLEQVLSNLLSNALKYTPSGGSIFVDVRRDGAAARLTVRDTGKGIAPDLIGHVFEMYKQERTYAATRSGLGLGLFIVKQLVELHAGGVMVESEGAGRGATFVVRLPLGGELGPPSDESRPALERSLRGLRVLVVDDDDDSRELMVMILRRAGAELASARDGDTALEVFGRWAPQVVVSDLAMPGSDGCALVSEIRARDELVTALAVSGFTSENDAQRAIEAGFDGHLAKPVDAATLVEAVHQLSLRHR